MPTIATHLKMMDQFSGPLSKVLSQSNAAITAMDKLRRVVERPVHADIDVGLDTSQALQEAQRVGKDVSRQIDKVTGQVEIDVTTQFTNALGKLDGPINRIHQEIEYLADVIQSNRPPESDGGIGVLGGMGKLLGVAAGVMGGSALIGGTVGGAAEQQQLQGSIQAQVGVDPAQAAALMQGVKEIYAAGWGESLQAVSNDVATVRQNLNGLSQEASAAFTQSAYAVQQVAKGETDISELSKVTRTLMANFQGLSETQALDLIATGFQRGGNYANDLLDTVNEYSVHFAGLGMSADQMFATLIAGSEQGAWNLDKVGDAVKESFIRLQDLSETSADAFKALGLDANKMAGQIAAGGESANQAYQATLLALSNVESAIDRNTIGVNLFGTQWEDLEDSVVLAMQAGQDGLGQFEGATARASEALQNNLMFQFEQFKRNFALGFAESGQGAIEALTPLFTMLNEAFQDGKFQPFFDGLSNGLTFVIDLITLLIENAIWLSNVIIENWSWIGPIIWGVVAALGTYLILTKGLSLAIQAAKLAQEAFNAVLRANPFVLIATLILGVITALIALWNTNDAFAAGLMRAWNSILNFFDQIPIFFTWVGNGIANAFDWAKVETLKIVDSMANGVIDKINWLIGMLNKIPGVSIDALEHLNTAGSAAAEAEAARQAREANLKEMQQGAAKKAAEREAEVKKFLEDRQAKRAKEAAEKAAKKAAEKEAEGKAPKGGGGAAAAARSANIPSRVSTPTLPTVGVNDKAAKAGKIGKVDKVGQVDKIKDKVDISSEDLKMMRELAEMKNTQNNVTLQPSINFGDTHVRKESDINTIVARITEKLEQDIASSVDAVYE